MHYLVEEGEVVVELCVCPCVSCTLPFTTSAETMTVHVNVTTYVSKTIKALAIQLSIEKLKIVE